MQYNPLKKIIDREFSWCEDWNQTKGDISKLMNNVDRVIQKLEPVYHAIGLDRLTRASERVLGSLGREARNQVEAGYLLGTLIEMSALYGAIQSNPMAKHYAFVGACVYAASLLYHRAMSENSQVNNSISGAPE